MIPKPKAILLDAFNTLFHNEPKEWQPTFKKVCKTQRLPVDDETLWVRWKRLEVTFREHRTNLQNPNDNPPFTSYEEAWRNCFAQVFNEMGVGDADAAAKLSVQDMSRRKPYPETLEALENLKSLTRLAIVSNADDSFLLPILKSYNVNGIELALTSEAARAYKPHPRPFRLALERMGLHPEEAIYVGDHPFDDVLGAHSVGIPTVWINRNGLDYDPKMPRPDYTISNLMELTRFVNSN